MQICIIIVLSKPSSQSQVKLPLVFWQVPLPQTPLIMLHSSMSVGAIIWNQFQFHKNGTIIKNTIALDSVFVEGVALVAPTRETTDAVFAATVVAHVGECSAFVDIFAVDVAVSFWTKFFESDRARFWTRIASVAPSFADTATTNTLEVMALQFLGADAVSVVEVTRLLTLIDAARAGLVQCQTGRASASEGTFRVDTDSAAFANARIQIAFVNVRASLAVHLGVTDRAVAFDRVAHFAWASPCQADRATTFGFQRQSREVVFATAVHHFGPARSFAVIY